MLQCGENRIRAVQIRLGPGGGHGRASGLSNQGPGKCFDHGFLTITRKANTSSQQTQQVTSVDVKSLMSIGVWHG